MNVQASQEWGVPFRQWCRSAKGLLDDRWASWQPLEGLPIGAISSCPGVVCHKAPGLAAQAHRTSAPRFMLQDMRNRSSRRSMYKALLKRSVEPRGLLSGQDGLTMKAPEPKMW